MSKKQWIILFLLFIAYLFLGATIFYAIERELEEQKRREAKIEQDNIKYLLDRHYSSVSNNVMNELVRNLSIYCGKPPFIVGNEEQTDISDMTRDSEKYVWTYYNSFFFALTTLSTIGYGNLSPSSTEGRWLVIVYSLIGIPFNGIVLAQLGDFFGSTFLRAHHRYKNHVYETRFGLILDILLYLIPGMAVFILAPTFVFQYFEGWTFTEGVYYAFVSLTTIGYGDFVAGQNTDDSARDTAYRIFLLIWIMFGLGYLAMILGFITRAMKSKRVNRLEHKLANTIKHTQSKIWNEFVQDVNYLRRALNELYLLKVKPVYKDKGAKPSVPEERRAVSCPDLSEWPILRRKSEIERERQMMLTSENATTRRRRALSENIEEMKSSGMIRVMSEGALEQIDRTATFGGVHAGTSSNDPGAQELLARIAERRLPVQADDSFDEEGGQHLFSDEEILQSEVYNTQRSWTGSWGSGARSLRSRASLDSPTVHQQLPLAITDREYDRQRTWAGMDSLHTRTMVKNMRARGADILVEDGGLTKEEKGRSSPANSLRRLSLAAISFFSSDKKKDKKNKENIPEKTRRSGNTFAKNTSSHRFSLQENDLRAESPWESDVYLTANEGRRPSLFDILAPPQSGNNDSSPPTISPVLEQTSVADLIRVMASLRRLENQPPPPQDARSGQSRHPSLSYLFQQPTQGHQPHYQTERRPSSAQTGRYHSEAVPRRRAASVTPSVDTAPVLPRALRPTRTSAPQPPQPPSVVVTAPDGRHRFSVHQVPSTRNSYSGGRRSRAESLNEIVTNP